MSQFAPISAERRSCPKCSDCGAAMRLFGIESHPTMGRTDLLTYVCNHCDAVQTETVAPEKLTPMDSLLAEKAFDADTTHVLGSAFDAAWERIEATNTVPADQRQAASMRELLAARNASAFPILLAHHPHAFDAAADAQLPLTLSGHTHGGQLMLNEQLGFGPAMFRYWSGLYERGASKLIVSNGVGNWFPLRLNAPAEVVHLTLRRA